ncbi:hypothetical protein GSI_11649 [Ganoderma sinense ZZ0214-1]|uniref:F-box domain-containing protein n=1 Tax=Ganoderma sinense ZZ0214-1 TaxID=1077348 RepID=A0A2G8RWK1_9APHY|nr:hypothetical protein GSI_11649 [Ganoderma sinense ZZ0214-1]
MSAIIFNDILYHILSHITADIDIQPTFESCFPSGASKSNTARCTLARLATAHSSFTKPALAALWGFLPSDKALKHILWVIKTEEDSPLENYEAVVTHGPSWTRFQEYASLVRTITIDPSVRTAHGQYPSKLRHGTFWARLSSALGGTPILPGLKSAILFSMHHFGEYDFDMGSLCLLNPSIHDLNVLFLGVGRGEQGNFRTVLSTCLPSATGHTLETLSVIVPVPVLDINAFPQSYPRLRRLKIDEGGILPEQLTLLATLPDLEYLSIVLPPFEHLHIPVVFPELRSLEIFSYAFVWIKLLIAHMACPKLQSLFISETHPDSDDTYSQELSDLLRTVTSKYPSLMAFRWDNRDITSAGMESASKAGMTLAELFDPMLSLRAMRSFSASFIGPLIPYSPSDFQKMAEAWPELETFNLALAGSGPDQYADLQSLASFARHCPRLLELRIPTIKFNPSDTSAPFVGSPMPHWLQELKVAKVALPTDEFEEVTRQQTVLLGLAKQVFPSARINFPVIRNRLRSRMLMAGANIPDKRI